MEEGLGQGKDLSQSLTGKCLQWLQSKSNTGREEVSIELREALEPRLLGLSDTLGASDFDIHHKMEFSKMQTCKGVQMITFTWISAASYLRKFHNMESQDRLKQHS